MKKIFRSILNAYGYKLIKNSFLESYYARRNDPRFRPSGDLNPLEQLFYKHIDDGFFFIQIGANDGKRYDPLHHLIVQEKDRVKGIAIEPVKEYFAELQETYSEIPAIKLLNVAIHNNKTMETIYRIARDGNDYGERTKGMASFDKNNFLKDGIAEEDVLEETVRCISFMNLLKQENVKKVHLLQIDAEGYDMEIIRSIDFSKIKPMVINFEHRWMYKQNLPLEITQVFDILLKNGYQVSFNGNDAIAYLT